MSTANTGDRPVPGTTIVSEIRIRICTLCGFTIGETGLCSYDCEADGEQHLPGQFITAVYKRTDVFLRDEGPDAA